MIGIVGRGVLLGVDSIIPNLNNITNIDVVELSSGVFEYLNAVRSVYDDYPVSIPVDWVGTTIMNCTFNSLNAGNLDFTFDNISKILIQRKRIDAPYNEPTWTTLFEVPIEDQTNLNFTFNDITNVNDAIYQYQLVPVAIQKQGGIDVEIEGVGEPSEEVLSSFDGVFICDANTFIKLYAGVEYGSMQTIQVVGTHQTLGNKYPIIVANSNTNYHTNSISGTILNKNYGEQNEDGTYIGLNRQKIVEAREELDKFLTNKKPKIIKDSNGNIWLVIFTDNINYSFFNEWGQGLGNMSATWTEIGDAKLGKDIRRVGIYNMVGDE